MKRLVIAALLLSSVAANAQDQTKPGNIPTVNAAVAIVTGNTFQTVLAAMGATPRRSLTIQNNNATDSCWLFVGPPPGTKPTSILLLPGQAYTRYFPYVPSDAIQGTCTTTADTLYVDTQ